MANLGPLGIDPVADAQDALEQLAPKSPRRPWGQFAVAVAILALAFAGLQIASNVSNNTQGLHNAQMADRRQRETAARLREAIQVACTVTANVVTRSGVSPGRRNGGPTGRPAPLSAQQRRSILRMQVLLGAMTPAQRRLDAALTDQIGAAGGLEVPDCKQIAEHPEDVKLYVPNTSIGRPSPSHGANP